jgi:hypothetical protein
MQMKRLNRFSFDRRSLALFASLALGSGLAAAQFTVGPAPAGAATAQAKQTADMFRKLDIDGNGGISRQEAAAAGGSLVRDFDALDANRDGVLSRAEFEHSAK